MPIKTANHFYDHLLVLRLFCTFIVFFYVRYVNSVKKSFSFLVVFMRFFALYCSFKCFYELYFYFLSRYVRFSIDLLYIFWYAVPVFSSYFYFFVHSGGLYERFSD